MLGFNPLAVSPLADDGSTSFRLELGQGSFTLTGVETNLLQAKILKAVVSSFLLTLQDVILRKGFTLRVEHGDFSLYLLDNSLFGSFLLNSEKGNFTLSLQDTDIIFGYILSISPGGFSLTSQSIAYNTSRKFLKGEFNLNLVNNNFFLFRNVAPSLKRTVYVEQEKRTVFIPKELLSSRTTFISSENRSILIRRIVTGKHS